MPAPKRKMPPNNFRDHPENINRKGRPRVGLTFAEMVREVMEEQDLKARKAKVRVMLDIAYARSKKGHFQFWDALVARGYGKVPDKIEMTTEEKPDLSKLSNEELAEWNRLAKKAKPG